MTDREQRLREIRERHEASTPGEWKARHRHVHCTADDDEQSGLGLEIQGPPDATNRGQFERSADAQFIAHAHQDIPFLLAEIERLEKQIPEFDYMHGIRSWSIAEPQSLDDAKRQLSEIRRMTAEHYGIDE